jgi:hypothetical protein
VANEYQKAQRHEDEVATLERYLSAHPDDEGNAYLRLGDVLAGLGRKDETREACARGIPQAERFGHCGVAEYLRLVIALLGGRGILGAQQLDRPCALPGEAGAESEPGFALSFRSLTLVSLDVPLQNRGLVPVASRLLVLVREGQQIGRILRVVGEDPLEVVDLVFHGGSSLQPYRGQV